MKYEEWKEIGKKLMIARDLILTESLFHKKTSPAGVAIRRGLRHLDEARNNLDDAVCELYPDPELKAEAIFYPGTIKSDISRSKEVKT